MISQNLAEKIDLADGGDAEVRLTCEGFRSVWRSLYGFVKRSSPCDARTGAAMYVAKYVTKSTGALVAPQFSAVGPRFPTVNLATA